MRTSVLSSARVSVIAIFASALALGLGGAACSSSDDSGAAAATGDGGLGQDGNVVNGNTDGGSTGNLDGGTGSDSGPTGPLKSGYVFVMQSTYSSVSTHSLSAGFSTSERTGTQTGLGCANRTEGACQVMICTPVDAGTTADASVDAGAATLDSAGVVTISGGKITTPMTLTPDAKNMYAPINGSGAIFASGDSITVSAAGAAVPAFQSTAPVPNDITVTAPTFTASSTSINKSQALNLAWTGGGAGKVNVSLTSTGAKIVSVTCSYDASSGTGVVPAAALTDIGASGSITMSPSNITSVTAGDYEISYTLLATGTAGSFTAN